MKPQEAIELLTAIQSQHGDLLTDKEFMAINLASRYLNPRTFCIEVSGGVVQDLYGLREGENYELVDWDDADGDEQNPSRDDLEQMIEEAKKTDWRYQ